MALPTSICEVMEYLLASSASNLPTSALAEVFDRLIWCLADNGDELLRVRDAWLESSDVRKVAIGLAMDETFPFGGADEMQTKLEGIAARWPELGDRCREIIDEWRAATGRH